MEEETPKTKKKTPFKYFLALVVILLLSAWLYSGVVKPNQNSTVVSGRQIDIIAPVGSKAPDFTLHSTSGEEISLSDYRGKKNVLLYFQEGVMCDPCWEQIVDIEKEYDQFTSKDIELISITVDPLNGLIKNARRFGITLPILADENLEVSSQYGVLEDAMHPGSRPGHSFVLVDTNGNIVWKKAYFIASGSTKMTMDMNGKPMTMDMGMDMGKPGSVMYLPVSKLLSDLAGVELGSSGSSLSTPDMLGMSAQDMSTADHSMCLTPIHYHVDFKMYLSGTMLNFAQNNYMDQSNVVHFHKTVKVKPEDIPNIPNGDIIHVHKEDATLREFLKTLDLPFNIDEMQQLKVYVDGDIQSFGLDYVLTDKDRVLITDSANDSEIEGQMDLVTDLSLQGKEKNPGLFGGC